MRPRGVGWALVGVLTAAGGAHTAAPARAADPGVRASQPLVTLLADHAVRTRPAADAKRIASVGARRPLTRVRTVLPVLGRATATGGGEWLRVALPGRPNGRTGWISADRTRSAATEWHVTVRLGARRVTVHRDGRLVRSFRAVIGAPSTPTPRGRFFVEEAVALSPGAVGTPFALALSARSEVLQEFAGGPGQIAIHGTGQLTDPLGTAASHGCVRLSTRAITWLARRIGSGVPVTVRR